MLYISYALFIIAFTGIYTVNPSYLNTLDTLIKVYVSLFLIIRFNPYIEVKSNGEFDRTVAFSAGIFLLLTTSIIDVASVYFSNTSLYLTQF